MMDRLRQDLVYAVRTLASDRLLTLTVVLSLGLAIGLITAVFSFVDAVLLRPLPYRDADRLVILWGSKTTTVKRGISGPNLADLRDQTPGFEGVVPFVNAEIPLEFGDQSSRNVTAFNVGWDFFSLLSNRPFLGRTFRHDDSQVGAENVVVLSYAFWESAFGENRRIIGQKIILASQPYVVVGVMPPQFFFPDRIVQVWLPITPATLPTGRGDISFHAMARLKPSVRTAQAQGEVDTVTQRLAASYPDTDKNLSVGLFSLPEQMLGNYRAAFTTLFAGVGLLLLIACANAAHMLLARGMRRGGEISIRLSLGATRNIIIRQLLAESMLLSVAAGVAGIFIALWGVKVLQRLGMTDILRFDEASIDHRVLLFALGVSILTGVLFGLMPALRTSQPKLVDSLKQGGTAYSSGVRSNLRDLLIVSEIAFAFALMAGAGLLIKSFVRLASLDWGFRPDHLLVIDVDLPYFNRDMAQHTAFAQGFPRQVLPRLKALPGVQSVSVARGSPIKFIFGGGRGVTADGTHILFPRDDAVGPGYFQTLGIPLLRGREFKEGDDSGAPKVAVLEKRLAEQLWPGQDPVGKKVLILGLKSSVLKEVFSPSASRHSGASGLFDDLNNWDRIPYQVVGIVGHVRTYGLLEVPLCIYVDYRQRPDGIPMIGESFFLRTSTPPSKIATVASDVIRAACPECTIYDTDTLEQRVRGEIGGRGSNRLLLVVSSVTSGLGLVLAAVGIYGVLAFLTSLRTREIGIRRALGAQRSQIFRMILRRGLLLTIAGVLIGLWIAMGTTKMLAGYLFQVSPNDPVTFTETSILFLLVAFLACYSPARRAMNVEPTVALKYE
jgi:putative ABC transport system permease protein